VWHVLPSPAGIFENGQINALLFKVAKTPLDRRGHHNKAELALRLIQGRQQLRQQPTGLILLSLEYIRRKIHRRYTHFLRGNCRLRQH
jgi:hypothetical protein